MNNRPPIASRLARWTACAALLLTLSASPAVVRAQVSFADVIAEVQPKIVKIYGAGGLRGLEAYQSGMLISADGHILTVWSHVLDTDYITATLYDGRRYEAQLLGADPTRQAALLKIDADGLPHFDLEAKAAARSGARVLAFSNLFGVATGDEPVSVQHGIVSVETQLAAQRGVFETPYRGPVYVLDAMTNNPGAAGGALTNRRGELLAMLGKELRNSQTNTWLNYALPIDQLVDAVDGMRDGRIVRLDDDPLQGADNPLDLRSLGIVLVPDVVERTPPYIDLVRPGSPAAAAGLRPDDLLMYVDDRLVPSCKALFDHLRFVERDAMVRLTVNRDQELLTFELQADEDTP